MKTEDLIPVQEFITHYEVELSFIQSLNEYGLIEITTVKQTPYIPKEQISDLERMIRLHYELEINIEGIKAITHLLQRVDNMHEELLALKNRLSLYGNE